MKLEIGDIITVDKLPDSFSSSDVITRIADDEVVVRTPKLLWVAERLPTPTVLDAEIVND